MLRKHILIINERDGITSTETLTVGRNFKYTYKIPYIIGIHRRYTIPYSNGSNRSRMNPCSNRQGILRIQSGTDGYWGDSPKKIYHENSPKNIDHVYDRFRANDCVRYDSPITRNPKLWVSYANVVRGVMRKHKLSHVFKLFRLPTWDLSV